MTTVLSHDESPWPDSDFYLYFFVQIYKTVQAQELLKMSFNIITNECTQKYEFYNSKLKLN